ncbi:MAG: hypothetical protein EB051_00370 [Chlamydiia bacterium]|nr:hypothetical protein [Chlamydiia bacterium]
MKNKVQILIAFLLVFISSNSYGVIYEFKNDPIDVVIPCHPKDSKILDLCISGIKANGQNIRRIIVVSQSQITDQAEWVPEDLFPFTKKDILDTIFHNNQIMSDNYKYNKKNRVGWIYQQLIKLYAAFTIPNISSNILVLDADTVFLNPVKFINPEGGAYLASGTEYHLPYFVHAKKLLPDFRRVYNVSGVVHHMLFQKAILEDLFQSIETTHGMPVWQAICACIDLNEIFGSPFSEYEIYFNFSLARTNQLQVRNLLWKNISNSKKIRRFARLGFHYVSCHNYE